MDEIQMKYQCRLEGASVKIAARYREKVILTTFFWILLAATAAGLILGKLVIALFMAAVVTTIEVLRRKATGHWVLAGREFEYFQRGLARLDGGWKEFEVTGESLRQHMHPYQDDLHVLGKGSLFQMICSARTRAGEERIAKRLLEPAPLPEILRRQNAVRELAGRSELREAAGCLGSFDTHDCGTAELATWLALPALCLATPVLWMLISSSSAAFLLAIGVWARVLSWATWLPWIAVLASPSLVCAMFLRKGIVERLGAMRPLSRSMYLLYEATTLLQTQNFSTTLLEELVGRLRSGCATNQLRRLTRIFKLLEQRDKPFFTFTGFFALGTLIVLLAESWRKRYQEQCVCWLDAWAEFEFLLAMSGLAYEYSTWSFPEISSDESRFQARSIGHPLLPAEGCVRNDISLQDEERYLFLSGSNMAGKSTLMRAVGLNLVLAYAGGPVCAESLTLTVMELCTSIGVSDSLHDGRSKFLAEVNRLAYMLDRARKGQRVCFLIDEILSGTNAEDRRIVAQAFLQQMPRDRTIGILSSHDSSLLRSIPPGGFSMHMSGADLNDPLSFDYRLKPGMAMASSASAIARMAGILGDPAPHRNRS